VLVIVALQFVTLKDLDVKRKIGAMAGYSRAGQQIPRRAKRGFRMARFENSLCSVAQIDQENSQLRRNAGAGVEDYVTIRSGPTW
jgi:hypothetical protein